MKDVVIVWNGWVYTYDADGNIATRTNVSGVPHTTFAYHGLGDRVKQTIDMSSTEYNLDLAGGLTQVLATVRIPTCMGMGGSPNTP